MKKTLMSVHVFRF